jgi:hypothetical protein
LSRTKKVTSPLLPEQEVEKQNNTYQDYTHNVVEGFISKVFYDGIIKEVKTEDLVKWFANPDRYHQQLENISQYFYISNGDVFQQFDLAKVLPTLNHKIEVYNKSKSYEKNILLINKMLNKVKYRTLTRDIIGQEITAGTLVGMWLGDKKNPYFYTFDNLEYIFPAYRKNGEWIAWLDLSWFSNMKEDEREDIWGNLSPYVDKSDYEKYLIDNQNYRYIELPQERTCVIRTHTTKRNQRLGIPWATQGLMDITHKKKLKDMEVAIANKIIRAVAILKLGNEKTPNPPSPLKKKVVAGVKNALSDNEKTGTPVIAIPEWSDLEFNDTKADALDPKKFETINSDINSSLGTGGTMKDGTGGNFASGKINFEVFYKKIAVLLEEIEDQIWSKFLNIILPNYTSDDYRIVFDKEAPLSLKDKLDALKSLQGQGYSTKAIIDCISDISWEEYYLQSLYEIETLKLREKIIPPQTFSTISKTDTNNGRTAIDNPDNENTQRSKTNDGNAIPQS